MAVQKLLQVHIELEAEFNEKVAKSGRTQKLLERSGSSTDEVAYNIPSRDQGERERSFTSSSSLIWGSSKHACFPCTICAIHTRQVEQGAL